jgi:hypothetical protein
MRKISGIKKPKLKTKAVRDIVRSTPKSTHLKLSKDVVISSPKMTYPNRIKNLGAYAHAAKLPTGDKIGASVVKIKKPRKSTKLKKGY